MAVGWGSMGGFAAGAWAAETGQDGVEDLIAAQRVTRAVTVGPWAGTW